MNIQAITESLIRMMRRKLELAGRNPGAFEELEWNRVLERAKARKDLTALQQMVAAWEMQLQREGGEIHLSQEAMQRIWQQAIQAGEACLDDLAHQRVGQLPTPADLKERSLEQAATAVKRRLRGYADAARALPVDASHAQVLTAMAQSEGFGNYQALAAGLAKAPAFCPCCGSAASVQSHPAGFACGRCGATFAFTRVEEAVPRTTDWGKLRQDVLTSVGYRVRRFNGSVRSQRYVWETAAEESAAAYGTQAEAYAAAWQHASDAVCEVEGISAQAWSAFSVATQALLVSALRTEPATR